MERGNYLMPLKIINPNWKSATQQKAETHAPAIAAWLAANPTNQLVSIAELRAGLPAIAGDLNRAVINHICSILGLEIQDPEDIAA
jgi:hypothetical protein